MALIERGETSAAQIRANRANAQKSTGPRTARGKRQVARNPAKRDGLLVEIFTESMQDLGEDPGAFRFLHRGFADSLRPANLLEEALVSDLAKLWWKKSRAERVQSAYQAHEIEKLEREHRQKLLGMDPEDRAGEEIIAGTTRISEACATNYHQVIGPLMYLLETVDTGDWLEEPQGMLDKIYGQLPTARGLLIKQMFSEWLEAAEELDDIRQRRDEESDGADREDDLGEETDDDVEAGLSRQVLGADVEAVPQAATAKTPAQDLPEEDSPDEELDFQELLGGEPASAAAEILEDEPETPEAGASPRPVGTSPAAEREEELRAALKSLLLEEIHEVTREYEVYQAARAPLTPAARVARMAPYGDWQGGRGNAWPLMLRQEASLARQLDRTLRLLLTLRKAQPGNPSGDGRRRRPGTTGPQGANGSGRNGPRGKSKGNPPRQGRGGRGGQKAKGKNEHLKRTNCRLSAGFPAAAKSAATAGTGGARSEEFEKQSRYVYENTGATRKKQSPIRAQPFPERGADRATFAVRAQAGADVSWCRIRV
ncbi:MAG: hypothetical protein HYS33_02910 [Acidobacteria bacterium]|nr:hypothetical protein [Acidobacteriota bacterium]